MSAMVAMSNNLVGFMVRKIMQNHVIFELAGRYDAESPQGTTLQSILMIFLRKDSMSICVGVSINSKKAIQLNNGRGFSVESN